MNIVPKMAAKTEQTKKPSKPIVSIFSSIEPVEIKDPVINEYTFEVVYDNIVNEDGSNYVSPRRYKSIGENVEEAKQDILEYNRHLSFLVKGLGYKIKELRLV